MVFVVLEVYVRDDFDESGRQTELAEQGGPVEGGFTAAAAQVWICPGLRNSLTTEITEGTERFPRKNDRTRGERMKRDHHPFVFPWLCVLCVLCG